MYGDFQNKISKYVELYIFIYNFNIYNNHKNIYLNSYYIVIKIKICLFVKFLSKLI